MRRLLTVAFEGGTKTEEYHERLINSSLLKLFCIGLFQPLQNAYMDLTWYYISVLAEDLIFLNTNLGAR